MNGVPNTASVLTPLQKEILICFALGGETVPMAKARGCSPKTIEYHRAIIKEKLNLDSIADLTHWAIGMGLIEVKFTPTRNTVEPEKKPVEGLERLAELQARLAKARDTKQRRKLAKIPVTEPVVTPVVSVDKPVSPALPPIHEPLPKPEPNPLPKPEPKPIFIPPNPYPDPQPVYPRPSPVPRPEVTPIRYETVEQKPVAVEQPTVAVEESTVEVESSSQPATPRMRRVRNEEDLMKFLQGIK